MTEPQDTEAFWGAELSRALQECAFGILSWHILESDSTIASPHSSANITLLPEDESTDPTSKDQISVELNLKGYKVGELHFVSKC